MERKLRYCSCCGASYNFCPRCPEDENKPNWYFVFCSENCNEIYNVTSQFEDNNITAIEAKERLEKLDLSRLDKFGTSYKSSIEKIMASAPIVSAKEVDEKKSENTIIDETVTVETENEDKELSIKKPRSKRAKDVE